MQRRSEGILKCARYAYPPNSLSLCGPQNKKNDIKHYTCCSNPDDGLPEIISRFSTLYPYLKIISESNGIRDPFDEKVVEAYWIGNNLLRRVKPHLWKNMLSDELEIGRKIKRDDTEKVYKAVYNGGFAHHSFHVLDIFVRTGNIHTAQSIQTADACIINYGTVEKKAHSHIEISTIPLTFDGRNIVWGKIRIRKILPPVENDLSFNSLQIGDSVSYHWGYFCQKINILQQRSLRRFTDISIKLANINHVFN